MRLSYSPLAYKYRINGIKQIREGDCNVETNGEILIEPRSTSPFIRYRKLRVVRKAGRNDDENALNCFSQDSATLLNDAVLELTPRGEPHYLANHEALNKKWIAERTVLNAKYTDGWVKRELACMTDIFSDEKKLRRALLQDFILHELYNRNIFKIVFDKETHKARQTCTETAFDGIPLLFEQEYKWENTPEGERIVIEGDAPLHENSVQIAWLCRGKTYTPEDITDIAQRTVYGQGC